MTGRNCSTPKQHYFTASLDFLLYESELAKTSPNCQVVIREPYRDGREDTWSGLGFTKAYETSTIEIDVNIRRTLEYDPIIRYELSNGESWDDGTFTLIRPGPPDPNGPCKNSLLKYDVRSFSLDPRNKELKIFPTICLEKGRNYKIKLVLNRSKYNHESPLASVLIDSVILRPNIENIPWFQGTQLAIARLREFEDHQCSSENSIRRPVSEVCKSAYTSIGAFIFDGALGCQCDPKGSVSELCSEYGGYCTCKPNVVGRRCDHCAPGTYGFGSEGCIACDCNSIGSFDNYCNSTTGQCDCRPNSYGRHCDQCHSGFWDFPNCQRCDCNDRADACELKTGACIECRDNTQGHMCNSCIEGFYGDPSVDIPCQQCSCPGFSGFGNSFADKCSLDVNTKDVVCECQEGYKGSRCDACADNYYGNPEEPGGSCQLCECNDNTDLLRPGNCDAKTGVCKQCLHDTAGDHCELCRAGYFRSYDSDICEACHCNSLGSLENYCNSTNGQCYCRANTDGRHCDQCHTGFWNFPNCQRCDCNGYADTCEAETGACIECTDNTEGHTCNSCIEGFYGDPSVNIPCEQCSCPGFSGSGNSFADKCSLDVNTKDVVCECQEGYTGSRCAACADNYYGNPEEQDGTCQLCECNDKTDSLRPGNCDAKTGVCKQCLHDTAGDHCELCRAGYFRSYDSDICEACDCNSLGSLKNYCNSTNGQCYCRANTDGRHCDQCHTGFWNFPNCERCDCNGYADTCEAETGACIECRDNTEGNKCDSCTEGFYGNPSVDIPCRPCQCPDFSGSGHSFGDKCSLDVNTKDVVCECQEGYTGSRCDACANNYYGNPEEPGGSCQLCECNDKTDLHKPGNCDAKTGVCMQCLYGTTGDHCELCRVGYFRTSDSVNCEACDCNKIGSLNNYCNSTNGQCYCRANAYGRHCDQCHTGFWNFPNCRRCDCNGYADTCEAKTGACIECRDNTEGHTCNSCTEGFYGDPGVDIPCRPCQCPGISGSGHSFADKCSLNVNTKDVVCECQEGYTGSRCDVCADNYYGNPEEQDGTCQLCDCNDKTDLLRPGNCDAKTGVCKQCLHDTAGDHCELCRAGYFRSYDSDICEACDCNSLGSLKNYCNSTNGQCYCRANTDGRHCDQCHTGFWNFPNCQRCDCNGYADTCEAETGACIECRDNTEGHTCNSCTEGFYGDPGVNIPCRPCECPGISGSGNSFADTCSLDFDTKDVVCKCQEGYTGSRCDVCAKGHFRSYDSDICEACDCNSLGSLKNYCNLTNGQCYCRANTDGRHCDQCHTGFWNFPNCQRCNCNGYADTCEAETGTCIECRDNTEGHTCNSCTEGFYGDPSVDIPCHPCQCPGISGSGLSFADTCSLDGHTKDIVCKCQEGYAGSRCDICAEGYFRSYDSDICEACDCNILGSLINYCNSTTGECYCRANTHGRHCDQCHTGFWNFPNCERCDCNGYADTCEAETGACIKCRDNTEGNKCDSCTEGFYGDPSVDIPCRPCLCPGLSGFGHSFADKCSLDVNTKDVVCECQEGYTGSRCDACANNYYGNPEEPGGSCQLCECNDKTDLHKPGNCDAKTGVCMQCLYGTTGDHCELCRVGYFRTSDSVNCEACDCNKIGSLNNYCNSTNGQCYCRANAYGRHCDQCHTGFWNFPNCRRCDCNGYADTCEAKTGACIECRDNTEGHTCNSCTEGFYGDPSVDIPCRPCQCPGISGSGHWFADKCSLNVSSKDVVCKCQAGYTGSRCDVCANGYFRSYDSDICEECDCNPLGTNGPCDSNTGQCPCYPNIVGKECDKCAPSHWKIASGSGCIPCNCDPIYSSDPQCNLFTGECVTSNEIM